MSLIWNITMHRLTNGRWRVTIVGDGGNVRKAIGTGRNAYEAYHAAEIQMVIKPALEWMKP